MVFDFLTRSVKKGEALGVSKAHAISFLSRLLTGQVEHLRSIGNSARSDGVECWLEVVDHFLHNYAAPVAASNSFNDLWNVLQKRQKGEITYSKHLSKPHIDVETCLTRSTRWPFSLIGSSRAKRRLLPDFESWEQGWAILRRTHSLLAEHFLQAQLQSFTEIANASREKNSKNVYCLELSHLRKTTFH